MTSEGLERFAKWALGSSRLSATSAREYVYVLTRMEELLGEPLLEMDEQKISTLLARMREGIGDGLEKKKYSDNYIKLAKNCLKRFYKYHGSELKDKIEVGWGKWQPPTRDKLLSDREFEEVIRNSDPTERALILTLYSTGARISEIVGDRKHGVEPARIEDLDRSEDIPFLYVVGKGGKKRILHFLLRRDEALGAISDYVEPRSKGPIFPFDRHRAWRLCKRAGDRAGVFLHSKRNLHPHMLRHMHATDLLLKYGFDIRVIQEDLGHSKLDITSGYLTISPKDIRKEAREKIPE